MTNPFFAPRSRSASSSFKARCTSVALVLRDFDSVRDEKSGVLEDDEQLVPALARALPQAFHVSR